MAAEVPQACDERGMSPGVISTPQFGCRSGRPETTARDPRDLGQVGGHDGDSRTDEHTAIALPMRLLVTSEGTAGCRRSYLARARDLAPRPAGPPRGDAATKAS